MPKQYSIPGPDGRIYSGTAPDDATEDQIRARVKAEYVKQQQRQQPASPPQQSSVANGAALNAINGLTLGFNDEVGGFTQALMEKGRAVIGDGADKRPFSQMYREAQQEQEGQEKQFQAEHPVAAAGAEVAGGAIPAFLTAGASRAPTALNTAEQVVRGVQPATRMGRILKGAGVGGAFGGTYGVGNSEVGDELSGGVQGALLGGVVGTGFAAGIEGGSALAGKLAGPLRRMGAYLDEVIGGNKKVPAPPPVANTNVNSGVADRVLTAMERDGTTPAIVAQRLRGQQELGKPASIVDVAGENTRDLGRATYTAPGAGKQIAKTALDTRGNSDAAFGRVVGDLESGMGVKSQNTDAMADSIRGKRTAQDNANYDRARSYGNYTSSEMYDLLNSAPVYREAYNNVRAGMERAGEAVGPPLFNAQGKVQVSPTVDDIDLIKRALDSELRSSKGPVIDRAQSHQKPAIRGVADRRQELVDMADRLNPEYAKARATSANEIERVEAIELGQNFLNLSPREFAVELKGFTPAQMELARTGALDALRSQASNAANRSKHANVIKSIFGEGAADKPKQLRMLFPDDASFDRWAEQARAELQFVETRNHVMGGSQTANKIAELNDTDQLAQVAGSAGVDLALQQPGTAIARIGREVVGQTVGRARAGYTEGVRGEIASQLFNQATDAEIFLNKLESMRLEREAQMTGRRKAGAFGGALGGQLGGN